MIVKSKYGFPHDQSLTNLEKPFKINVQEEPTLCFLKPKSMAWFGWNGSSKVEHWDGAADNSLPVRDSVQGGGVTSDFFITKGFIAKPTQPIGNVGNFPTIGFTGAEFTIEMLKLSSGSYELSSNNSEVKITPLNAYQAKVKFYNKFTNVNIHITQGSWSMDYPIKIQTWADPRFIGVGANNAISYADAQTYCGGLSKILTRSEFTNTPRALSSGWLSGGPNTLFTRAIGSITGEWGRLSNAYSMSYGDSLWIGGYYWTSDTYGTAPNNIFVSGVTYGSIVKDHSPDIDTDPSGTPSGPYVACRG